MDSRTPEELNNPDYNYYFAYKISPAEKDSKKIEASMATQKNSFTQGSVIQRRLKDLYSEAVNIMNDKALRDKEFQAAKKFKLENAEKAIISIVKGSGTIYKSDLKKMADASGEWLKADEIEKKIEYLVKQGAKLVDDTQRILDFLTYDKIETYLKIIGKSNLYELLGTAQKSPINVLLSAVTTVYNSVSGTDPKSTAKNQICGEAKKVFKDDNSKKYYDIYLATKDIWEEFKLRRDTGVSEMEHEEFLRHLEKAKDALKALNITDENYIEVLLADGLNSKYRITLVGRKGQGVDLEICPYCGITYAANYNPKNCPHCGNQLEFDCWNCGGKAWKTTCPSCGAKKDDVACFESVVKKLEALRVSFADIETNMNKQNEQKLTDARLLIQKESLFADIETELNNLKKLLPNYKKIAKSKLTQKIVEYEKLIYEVKFSVVGGGTLEARAGNTTICSGTLVAPGTDIRFDATPKLGHRVNSWDVNNKINHENNGKRYYLYTSGSGPINVKVYFGIIPHYIYLWVIISGMLTAFFVDFEKITGNMPWDEIFAVVVCVLFGINCVFAIFWNHYWDKIKHIIVSNILFCMGLLVVWTLGFIYVKKANAHFDKGQYDIAIKDYNRFTYFSLWPGWKFYTNRGNAYESVRNYNKAIADYTEAIRVGPKGPNSARLYTNRGNAYDSKGDYGLAIADYTKAMQLEYDRTRIYLTYHNRGSAYNSKGDYDRAIAYFTEMIRLEPNNAMAYHLRGYTYYNKRKYALAIADYEAALRIDPKDESAKRNLEMARKAQQGK